MVNPIVRQRKRHFWSKKSSIPSKIARQIPWKFFPLIAKYIWIFVIVLIIILGVRYILSTTIFSSQYTIQTVRYDSGSVAAYDNPYLYQALRDHLQGKNIYLQKYFHKKQLLEVAREIFPWISVVELFYLDVNTAAIRLHFNAPEMVFVVSGSSFGVYGNVTFPLQKNSTLSDDLLHIDLPNYLWTLDSLDGIFFRVPGQTLLAQFQTIEEYFTNPQRIVYLPWSARVRITTADGRNIYINSLQDIERQLQKIDRLKRYYPAFDSLREMDLWSLDDNKIIVKQ